MLRWKSLFDNRLPRGVRRKQSLKAQPARKHAVEPLEDRRMLATITVNSVIDIADGDVTSIANLIMTPGMDGVISLREAITAANNTVGLDNIEFNILGGGVQTIQPGSALPIISDSVIIDGYTQMGAMANTADVGEALNTMLTIELDGQFAGPDVSGLEITAGGGGSTIRGLAINRFTENGVFVSVAAANGNTIAGNFIGTDATGLAALANGDDGIDIRSGNNTIGGNVPAARNLISGNNDDGIFITGNLATGNMIQGNYIGIDATGMAALANGDDGIQIQSSNNTIGGNVPGARNVISGNVDNGIVLFNATATENTIAGNYIGTDATGLAALANGDDGVDIRSANNIVGGTDPSARNVISGNGSDGIVVTGTGNMIQGNLIGTDVTGIAALANGLSGIDIRSANNIVGGTDPGARNVISGNSNDGIIVSATGNMIQGNFIGTDVTGMAALANGDDGITLVGANNTVGGTDPSARNVISGNVNNGVLVSGASATGNIVQGNFIGTDVTGMAALANGGDGVGIQFANNNIVGGTAVGAGNRIAFNQGNGVAIDGDTSTSNAIRQNSIFSNVGLGIDLNRDGVTGNDAGDADAGENNLQNFPDFLGSATLFGDSVSVSYNVDTLPANAAFPLEVEFFFADADNQEGRTFLATDTFSLAEQAAGSATVVFPVVPPGLENTMLVATVTDALGNTSEFSAPVAIVGPVVLGSAPEVLVQNIEIANGETDFYQYTAHETGKLVINTFFIHLFGDLDLEVRDNLGNLIASSATSSATQNFEQLVIPVVGQEQYIISVIGTNVAGGTTTYDLEIENFPAPIPTGIHLDPTSDLGRLNNDELTSQNTPTLIIQTDVLGFVDTDRDLLVDDGEITVLTAAQAAAGTTAGITVEVTLFNTTNPALAPIRGFANPLSTVFPTVYNFTPENALPDGVYFATARTVIIDGQTPNELGRSGVSEPLWFTIDTLKPNVFFGEPTIGNDGLHPDSDSGVSVDPVTLIDRITNDTTPTLFGRAEANSTVRVFVLNNAGDRVFLGETVATPFDGNNPLATGQWQLTSALDLNSPLLGFPTRDGLRQFEIEAEDVAGNISRGAGFSLPDVPQAINDNTTTNFSITVADFVGPITDLDVGLDITHPDLSELTISLTSPTGTTVELVSGQTGVNLTGTLLDDEAANPLSAGAAPFTGSFQPIGTLANFDGENPNGDWTLTIIDAATDNAGTLDSFSLWFQANLDIFLDTQGPQVNNVFITADPTHDLFDPKPSTDGPTPLINSLTIDFVDQPNRVANFAHAALVNDIAENPGNYRLTGDRVGNVAIQSAAITASSVALGSPANSTVTLTFARPLEDDRYTLTISDNLVDPAGNQLDGESNADEPQENPLFPTGDGLPGGDFVARFTVDTRPEIGVWSAGTALIDTNGNFLFDPENVDATNRDITYLLGFAADYPFAGNFVQGVNSVADGFDKLAAYGRVGNQWRWLIDTSNDGVPDLIINDPSNISGVPVAGNFDNNAVNGDEVGIFTGAAWHIDTDHDFLVDTTIAANYNGYPIVGDFNGDGADDFGTYSPISNQFGGNLFSIDTDRNGTADFTFRVGIGGGGAAGGFNGFPGVRERPVAADLNADGFDDIGLWVPDGSALNPGNQGEWFFLVSGDIPVTDVVETSVLSRINNNFVTYTPTPFGNDFFARFGNSFALPLVGNFDPPVVAGAGAESTTSSPTSSENSSSTTTPTSDTEPTIVLELETPAAEIEEGPAIEQEAPSPQVESEIEAIVEPEQEPSEPVASNEDAPNTSEVPRSQEAIEETTAPETDAAIPDTPAPVEQAIEPVEQNTSPVANTTETPPEPIAETPTEVPTEEVATEDAPTQEEPAEEVAEETVELPPALPPEASEANEEPAVVEVISEPAPSEIDLPEPPLQAAARIRTTSFANWLTGARVVPVQQPVSNPPEAAVEKSPVEVEQPSAAPVVVEDAVEDATEEAPPVIGESEIEAPVIDTPELDTPELDTPEPPIQASARLRTTSSANWLSARRVAPTPQPIRIPITANLTESSVELVQLESTLVTIPMVENAILRRAQNIETAVLTTLDTTTLHTIDFAAKDIAFQQNANPHPTSHSSQDEVELYTHLTQQESREDTSGELLVTLARELAQSRL